MQKLILILVPLLQVVHLQAAYLGPDFVIELKEELEKNNVTSGDSVRQMRVDLGDGSLTVPQIIEKYGYPAEIHHVTTEDGYILELHRIPYGKECGPAPGKKVAFLQHGIIADSSNWILGGVNHGLGYKLADACYDVWMGNARGNTYSKRHVEFPVDANSERFWAFSWGEMGRFDLPANFDYILNITEADGLYYTGHSMGTTMFFVCMSERPEYNSKIKLMNAMAPVAFTENMITPVRLIAPFEGQIEWLLAMMGAHEFLPTSAFMEFLGRTVCRQESAFQDICNNVVFLVAGYNIEQLDRAFVPLMMMHMPSGASVRSVTHFAQGVNSGKFRKYNYGSKAKNQEAYGQDTPPDYDISKITCPVALYWGENDWLAATSDVHRLAEQLPNLQRKYRIAHDTFNHLDFLFGLDIIPLVNTPVMNFMAHF